MKTSSTLKVYETNTRLQKDYYHFAQIKGYEGRRMVMRNGVMVDVEEHNRRILQAR